MVEIDNTELAIDIAINPVDLDNGMLSQASLFARYAYKSAQAQSHAEKMKASFEILESALDGEHRSLLADGGGKVTEAMIRQAIVSDGRWGKAQAKLIEARTTASFSKDVLEAFKQKRDMLVQLGINSREEMKGVMRVMDADQLADKRKAFADKVSTGKH